MLPILYKRTSKGQVQTWQILTEDNTYWVEEGISDGKITVTKPHVCEPKNFGKANFSNAYEQAIIEARAKWTKKLKTGYVQDIKLIDESGFEKPMKGDKWEDRFDEIVYPVLVSDKLNGVRLRVRKVNGEVIAISTGGEKFFTIPHIIKAVSYLFEKYPLLVLDSEAFNFNLRGNLNRLIEIVSVQRKEKDVTPELLAESEKIVEMHCFDCYGFENITKETPYRQRFEALGGLLKGVAPCVEVVPVDEVQNVAMINKMMAANKKSGGEGLIIRYGDCPYKHGRSKFLLKNKHKEDCEFELVDLKEGNADWTNCAKRAILKLNVPAATGETTFASNIHGDMPYLRQMLKDKNKIIGQMATVEFQCWSEYKIPQLPWLVSIRNYE